MLKNLREIHESIILGSRVVSDAMKKKDLKIYRDPATDAQTRITKEELGIIYGPAILHCTKAVQGMVIVGAIGYEHNDLIQVAEGEMLDVPISDDDFNEFGFFTTGGYFVSRHKAVECVKYAAEKYEGIILPTVGSTSSVVHQLYSYHIKSTAWRNAVAKELAAS